jgi:4-azaleucine resistance transporter AzlC
VFGSKKITKEVLRASFSAAYPVMLGYIASGIPCGILSASVGMNWIQVLLFSVCFYSGAGQFMIPNMLLAGSNLLSIIGSVSFVNTRQVLYSAALAPKCRECGKRKLFWYMATVTDETFGISIEKFNEGNWTVENAIFLNEFSHLAWTSANLLGVLVGNIISIPLEVAAFAMTSLFIYLLTTALDSKPAFVAAAFSILSVIVLKSLGAGSASIFFASIIGVGFGYLSTKRFNRKVVA